MSSHSNTLEGFLRTLPGIPSNLLGLNHPSQSGLLSLSLGHTGTDYVEIYATVKDGPILVGTAPTLSVKVWEEDSWLDTWRTCAWKVIADWKVSEATPEPTEPQGMFKAIHAKDFLEGDASVYEKDSRVFLLARHCQSPVEAFYPDESEDGSCSLVWVPTGDKTGWAAWPYKEQGCGCWLPLDTPPTYTATAPQGWTLALEATRPIHVATHTALVEDVALAVKIYAGASRDTYEATLGELHRKISGFQSVPQKLRRQWHHEVNAAFSAARQTKLGVPVVVDFFHPNVGVEESLFTNYQKKHCPETVHKRFERADGSALGWLVIGTGPADMAVAVRAKSDFDLATAQDFGWEDEYGAYSDHIEFYNPEVGYVRESGTGRTCYTLSVDPNTRKATVKQ